MSTMINFEKFMKMLEVIKGGYVEVYIENV